MARVDLLRALPKPKPGRTRPQRTAEDVAISRRYDFDYWDGDRRYGYGGYKYDGRWASVARDIAAHFGLKPGDRVLDVGCGKGFLVKDLCDAGLSAFGLDISRYALMHAHPDTVGRLHWGSAVSLPFPDHSFDAVVSINTIHNLEHQHCVDALREIERVGRPGKSFVVVDSWTNPTQEANFWAWFLTAHTYGPPDFWQDLFSQAGYTGDWDWTLID